MKLISEKKQTEKNNGGRDWKVYRAGNLSPDLPGASVHHPWADRAGAPGHKVVGWGGSERIVWIPIFSFFPSDWPVPI